MSRTTTVGSPTTVPMTRLSPGGTVAVQWTSDVGPVGPVGLVTGLLIGDVAGLGLCDAAGEEPPHATSMRSENRATRRTCTRQQ